MVLGMSLVYQVRNSLGADFEDDYAVDAIVSELRDRFGLTDSGSIDSVDSDEYWALVERHDNVARREMEKLDLVSDPAGVGVLLGSVQGYLERAQAGYLVDELRAKGADEFEVAWKLELAKALFGWGE